jgi:hypothetical protein
VKLAAAATKVASVHSVPVTLRYDLATASNDGTKSEGGFDGHGNALPAEMLPAQVTFNDVAFHLAPAKTGSPNAVVAKGQTIDLPAGHHNRVYILAASADGDQRATFKAGNAAVELNIQNWGGFIGQWDDRQWTSKDTSQDDYGQMTGIKPGYIKRAEVAWYCSHHHNAAGENVSYRYSYLFAYPVELPAGAKTLTLPDNDKIRVLAISVADESSAVKPAQPLYDVLPSPATGATDFVLSASASNLSFTHDHISRVSISGDSTHIASYPPVVRGVQADDYSCVESKTRKELPPLDQTSTSASSLKFVIEAFPGIRQFFMSDICSAFVTESTLWFRRAELVKNFSTTEGEEWIRTPARAAAVPDTLPGPSTLAASPTAWHSSACSVRPAPAVDGENRFPLQPRADRTACGACENVRARCVMLPP